MKLYTFVVHYLQMCMKECGCCLKFKRRDNSTNTFTKRGVVYLVIATPPKAYWIFMKLLHIYSTLPADVHERIWLLSKV